MVERTAMLAQPCESFKGFFAGRVPSMAEKAFFVEQAIQRTAMATVYQNDIYRVEMTREAALIHLEIRRRDGKKCVQWYDIQRIKNELVGPQNEAVQLFPAESRVRETESGYHLWVYPDANLRIQLGFKDRFVLAEVAGSDPSQD